MNGHDFIVLAGKLATFNELAASRTAISRAYYGAFHLAREFLDEIGLSIPRNANSHVSVARVLNGLGHATTRHAGRMLSDLHSNRLRADYQLNDLRVEQVAFARACVVAANEVEFLLEECRREPARSEIQALL